VRFARRWQSWVGPSVAPIEGVQLRIGILKLKRQTFACADAAIHRVTHLGFLVLEAIGQLIAELKRLLLTNGYSQEQIASDVGVSPITVNQCGLS